MRYIPGHLTSRLLAHTLLALHDEVGSFISGGQLSWRGRRGKNTHDIASYRDTVIVPPHVMEPCPPDGWVAEVWALSAEEGRCLGPVLWCVPTLSLCSLCCSLPRKCEHIDYLTTPLLLYFALKK